MTEHLTRPEIKAFIRKHENDDVRDLMLNRSRYPELPMAEIAAQIRSRQKAKDKLPEWYAHEEIVFPDHLKLQQSSSETTARYKASRFSGDTYLDLTGGTGIDAYYFMQQFERGVILEPDQELHALLTHNFKVSGLSDRVDILNIKAEDYLRDSDQKFDLIYADPSRRSAEKGKVAGLRDSSPDITGLIHTLKERAESIVIKASPMTDHREAAREVGGVSGIIILSVRDEVKEVLLKIDGALTEDPEILVEDLDEGHSRRFSFRESEEIAAQAEYSMPLSYLYDPMRGLRKAGCFNCLSERFDLNKLGPNTHLYTSKDLIADFPGRRFEVTDVIRVNRKALARITGTDKVNLALRNYPGPISALRKKLGTTDGGQHFVFATETSEGYRLIVCERS